jgi:hypothetical protein
VLHTGAQVKAGCEVLAAQARRSGRPVPKSLASPGDVATPDDHGAFFRGERQVPRHTLRGRDLLSAATYLLLRRCVTTAEALALPTTTSAKHCGLDVSGLVLMRFVATVRCLPGPAACGAARVMAPLPAAPGGPEAR